MNDGAPQEGIILYPPFVAVLGSILLHKDKFHLLAACSGVKSPMTSRVQLRVGIAGLVFCSVNNLV
ncbi:hypothetical protein BVC80_521g124 [Macleaya cordata]|uniref:Uncharacterized protein n=1 Tax=Macleaya cordata TaxID=56857 RepID=A0A200R9C9_MACCD|nr:hypothetical protein BVC80_521g124 [Macleaya cordata]